MSCTREQGGVTESPSQRLIAATLRTRGGTRAVHEPVLDLGPLPSVEEGPR